VRKTSDGTREGWKFLIRTVKLKGVAVSRFREIRARTGKKFRKEKTGL
jgi:hypothetical protein